MFYGQKYHDSISELVRKKAECCDSLESFFIMHSMGGGTGSGLGTAVLSILADEYKEVQSQCILQSMMMSSPRHTIVCLQ